VCRILGEVPTPKFVSVRYLACLELVDHRQPALYQAGYRNQCWRYSHLTRSTQIFLICPPRYQLFSNSHCQWFNPHRSCYQLQWDVSDLTFSYKMVTQIHRNVHFIESRYLEESTKSAVELGSRLVKVKDEPVWKLVMR
jgi:hypothetical protein